MEGIQLSLDFIVSFYLKTKITEQKQIKTGQGGAILCSQHSGEGKVRIQVRCGNLRYDLKQPPSRQT